ncbi:hypothetical protein Nepgr_010909 [Nepenthes gracilis]|uniref:very-long-chain 3-oxoacyl-CoA synthase n=1 Tax=Nepenthes gracilis TaxID=150966 RepID=A0AAD3SDV0_NEPGR|nr:hypothetical protein Nepgr_010909 [Nepenthes gracilis]
MRDDVKSFNVSGMGCSGSMLAVDMAQNLLRVHKDSNAVVLSTEILTTGWYSGNERNKLILNCLFRMGSAAILLSNRMQARRTSKYKLVRTLRTQRAFDDRAYRSAMRDEDSKGFIGVTLNRDIPSIVCEIARASITSLGSSILPSSEKLKFGLSILKKMLMKGSSEIYSPDFKRVIDHFCLPNSGRDLIKGIAKGLKLNEKDVEAALATLHRFGNQSSSSLWYELAYLEAKERVKKGDKVWQLGIGTGLKSTSVVWECIRPILGESKSGPWADCIDQYPTSLALD